MTETSPRSIARKIAYAIGKTSRLLSDYDHPQVNDTVNLLQSVLVRSERLSEELQKALEDVNLERGYQKAKTIALDLQREFRYFRSQAHDVDRNPGYKFDYLISLLGDLIQAISR